VLERTKARTSKTFAGKSTATPAKIESSQSGVSGSMWNERQLRDYRCANNLCYFCRDKFSATHLQKCPKRNKPKVNALVVNNLDGDDELIEETLNNLDIQDVLVAKMGQLSLNALSGTGSGQQDYAYLGGLQKFS
jgi:hypothetical protein